MEIEEYSNIRRIDTTHFYYKTMVAMVKQFVRKYAISGRPLTILDAGCGTGYLSCALHQFGDVVCVDIHPIAVNIARARGLTVKQASVTSLPFRSELFDTVVSVDVLYHRRIKNDEKALFEFFRVLKPGGVLLLRVPAHSHLYSRHDAFVHAARRYSKKEITGKVQKTGFIIEYGSYAQGFLYPMRLICKLVETVRKQNSGSDIGNVPGFINRVLSLLLRGELLFQNIISLPIGIGVYVVARKPGRKA